MRRLSQPVCLMIGIQAICLGLGFWFQYILTVSTTEHGYRESAWSELAIRSNSIVRVASQLQARDLNAGTPELRRAQALLDSDLGAEPLCLLLTDADGRILCRSAGTASVHWKVGDRIPWHFEREAEALGHPQRGRLKTLDGERTAIAYPAREGRVQVIAYSAESTAVPAGVTSLLTAMPLSGGIAFAWTLILCAVATCLLAPRFSFKETHSREQHNHEALRSAQDLLRTRDAVIFGLAKLAESRDPETGDHLERITLYTTCLAAALRLHPKYQRVVTPTFIRLLGISSVLHDIGKVGLEDTVLLKPGRLTGDERKRMQQHTLVAGDCLKEIEQRLGASNFLQTAREIALHHHERWDGTGYPAGLAGEAIPLAARIVSIADVYDALRSKRIYKAAFPHEECVRNIRQEAGTQFDPDLVEVFLEIEPEFNAIARRFANDAVTNRRQGPSRQHCEETPSVQMSSDQEVTLREVLADPETSSEFIRGGVSVS